MSVRPSARCGFTSLWLALVLPCLAPGGAAAQEVNDRDIIESQRRLQQIRAERDELRDEMSRIRSRVSDMSSELTNLDRQVGTASELLAELEFQLSQRERQIEANTYALLMTRDRLAERRAVLHRRLRDVYKRGPVPTLQVLLGAESFSDLLNRYRYLHMIARHDRRLADEVADLERQLVIRERSLRANLAQLESVRGERSAEFSDLAEIQNHQRSALSSVRSRESATAQRMDQLERDEVSLSTLIAEFERRRRAGEAGSRTAGGASVAGPAVASMAVDRMGALDWPLDGRLLYNYGRTVQPNGTAVRWNGIGIEAPAGAPVHSVEAGVVALAGPFEGYGPTVIVSHGGGYYTLYLYLRDLRVAEGDEVQRGETIGTVGGPAVGNTHIEFQVRIPGGQAVDPLAWLRRR